MELKMFERKSIYREMSKEYQRSRKKEKTIILDFFLKTTGLTSRNYAERLLRLHEKSVRIGKKEYVKTDIVKQGKISGRRKKYSKEVVEALIQIYLTQRRQKAKSFSFLFRKFGIVDEAILSKQLCKFQRV